ncbi:peptidyl-prolyl cis-trans isomerase Pin1 [Microbotryomycetes sp. JL221]|nr:peptidyl-prolyl cis-trans isomerase Pin1 [Microbotryomycetes sp. JL221]
MSQWGKRAIIHRQAAPLDDQEVRFSNTRQRPYFYNDSTRESRWVAPEGYDDQTVLQLPGAHLLSQGGGNASSGAAEPSRVRAMHLLVKHNQSRRPASWKSPNITRTKDEAIEILKGYEQTLRQADDLQTEFARLAKTESDCSSARQGGDLDWFGRNQMQKPFEQATFGLPVGSMSSIVETDSGVHLILRTG